jgi:hypothetical protein
MRRLSSDLWPWSGKWVPYWTSRRGTDAVVDVDGGLKGEKTSNETRDRRTVDETIQAFFSGHAGTDRGWSSKSGTVRWRRGGQDGLHSTTRIDLVLYTQLAELLRGGNIVGQVDWELPI